MRACPWDILVVVQRLVKRCEAHLRRLGVRVEAYVEERLFVGGVRPLDVESKDDTDADNSSMSISSISRCRMIRFTAREASHWLRPRFLGITARGGYGWSGGPRQSQAFRMLSQIAVEET